MRKRALIVANQQYDDGRFHELPGAAADARELASVLSSPLIGEFEVSVVAESDARTVKHQIERFFASGGRDDLLLLHLSCHGRRDSHNHLYFVAKDTDHEFFGSTGIEASFINDRAERSRSRRIVLLLDCCYSGTFVKGFRATRGDTPAMPVDAEFPGSGIAVITACSALQFAYDSDRASLEKGQPSVFTSAVVEGLRTGAADADGDGFVSVQDLFAYARRRVTRTTPHQTPEFSVNRLSGELYLARTPASIVFGGLTGPRDTALHRAIVRGADWERFGATLALERLLTSSERAVRLSAREALVPLTRDADPEVRTRARAIWAAKVPGRAPLMAGDPGTAADNSAGRVLGIDFGTTNSVVVVLEGDEPSLITNRFGSALTPSVVGFSERGDVLVGEIAKRQAVLAAERTVQSVKLILGTDRRLTVGTHDYSPEEIVALILERLRLDAEAYLEERTTRAVITVPTHFSTAQRESLNAAAEAAGISVLGFLNEPTAAALAYGFGDATARQTILVFDLGGGTLDVSLLGLGPGFVATWAVAGDEHLGGQDWDRALVDHLAAAVAARDDLDVGDDLRAMQRLGEAAESAKIELSRAEQVPINLLYLGETGGRPVHLSQVLTRAEFESITAGLLDRCRRPIEDVLLDAEIATTEVDHVLLVGGATRMPAVVDLMRRVFDGREPSTAVHPDQAIAIGAARYAGMMAGEGNDVVLLDVTSMSYGLREAGGAFLRMVYRNARIPVRYSEVFTTTQDHQKSVTIQIFEGEREIAAENRRLGVLELTGLAPMPRGGPRIEVTFDLDLNGILHVSAKDLGTGKAERLTISRRSLAGAAVPGPATADPVRIE